MTPPPTLQDLIDTVRQDAGTDDPIGQLAVASATASELEQTTDALLGHFVDRCRRAGRSWSEISAALGVTKQAVHKRFAGPLAERLVAATGGGVTFERFTQRARNALVAANSAAKAGGQGEIGTGHLLLGLYSEPDGLAAKALEAMQVSHQQVEQALRAAWDRADGANDGPGQQAGAAGPTGDALPAGQTGPGSPGPAANAEAATSEPAEGRLPVSPAGRTALLDAVAVALEFGHNYIGTEHMLLGLYRNPDCLAARVLAEAGADRIQAQVRVAELLRAYTVVARTKE